MKLKHPLIFIILILVTVNMHAQRSRWDRDYNLFGTQAGGHYTNIVSNQLPVTGKASWTAGFTYVSSLPDNWQLVYGLNFYDFKVDIDGRQKLALDSRQSPIEYNMIGVQASIFGSYKLYDHFLSVEAGPVIQVNGNLDARQDKELYYLAQYDITALEIEKVSPFNVHLAAGLTGGFEKVKFRLQYQHGLTNIFGKLNKIDFSDTVPKFSGRMSIITAGVIMFI